MTSTLPASRAARACNQPATMRTTQGSSTTHPISYTRGRRVENPQRRSPRRREGSAQRPGSSQQEESQQGSTSIFPKSLLLSIRQTATTSSSPPTPLTLPPMVSLKTTRNRTSTIRNTNQFNSSFSKLKARCMSKSTKTTTSSRRTRISRTNCSTSRAWLHESKK